MNIGCLFGTFDPPHRGHVAIAEWMREHVPFEEVWLAVTPRNPFKLDRALSADHHRAAMVRLAIEGREGLRSCEEELRLPAPNYTVDTLAHFRQRWPDHRFSLIIGSDNLAAFDRWRDPQGILAHHAVVVYPRGAAGHAVSQSQWEHHPGVRITQAPLMDISSTRIRKAVAAEEDTSAWLDPQVRDYIVREGLYAG
jgi:nicotinate-nucleotide adenylyltransferase